MKTHKIGLYIHIPWCVQKCPYCDFNSHAMRGPIDESRYVNALLRDLDEECQRFDFAKDGVVVDSIFFGGGTPSVLTADAVARIVVGVEQRLPMDDSIEITLEANPGASEQSRFEGYRAAGVNRLSIGIQSLENHHLKRLGRVHDVSEAHQAVKMARRAGFSRLNLDMMFALPEQTLSAAAEDLRELIALAPDHISYYQLTLEPNTYFYTHPPPLPEDDLAADMQLQGQAMLAAAGFIQYEVSAYARESQQCRHNLHYWRFDDYIGIGAGAHGKMSSEGELWRRWKWKSPKQYLAAIEQHGSALAEENEISPERQLFEFMLNRLRLRTPVMMDELSGAIPAWSDVMAQDVASRIRISANQGLATYIEAGKSISQFSLTRAGHQFLNSVLLRFLES